MSQWQSTSNLDHIACFPHANSGKDIRNSESTYLLVKLRCSLGDEGRPGIVNLMLRFKVKG